MVASAGIRSENDGREQVVYMPPGVVPMVHEFNGSWTRMPPHQPIFDWVTGKLGLSGKEAQRVTIAIRRKILRMGLTLPNKEGRGQMFKRTFDLYTRTRAHYVVFKAALRSLLPRS